MKNRPVTVYTNPSCVQCDQTKRFLDNKNIPYEVVDLSQNPAALTMVLEQGFTSAPVVFAGDLKWSGFRLDKLVSLTR